MGGACKGSSQPWSRVQFAGPSPNGYGGASDMGTEGIEKVVPPRERLLLLDNCGSGERSEGTGLTAPSREWLLLIDDCGAEERPEGIEMSLAS